MQDLKVSVAGLLGKPGEYRDVSIARPLDGIKTSLATLGDTPVRADLRLESVIEGVLVTGSVDAKPELECARCLTSFGSDLSVEVTELFAAAGHEVAEGEDTYEVEGDTIDLEPLLRDAVTLALPLNPLCREDCRGLCARCGTDLNAGECDCTEDEIDPRWAELAVLRDKLQG